MNFRLKGLAKPSEPVELGLVPCPLRLPDAIHPAASTFPRTKRTVCTSSVVKMAVH